MIAAMEHGTLRRHLADKAASAIGDGRFLGPMDVCSKSISEGSVTARYLGYYSPRAAPRLCGCHPYCFGRPLQDPLPTCTRIVDITRETDAVVAPESPKKAALQVVTINLRSDLSRGRDVDAARTCVPLSRATSRPSAYCTKRLLAPAPRKAAAMSWRGIATPPAPLGKVTAAIDRLKANWRRSTVRAARSPTCVSTPHLPQNGARETPSTALIRPPICLRDARFHIGLGLVAIRSDNLVDPAGDPMLPT